MQIGRRCLCEQSNASGERRSLRLMDFRHTFASERISQWNRQSQPVAHHLLLLARYLGDRTIPGGGIWGGRAPDPTQPPYSTNLNFASVTGNSPFFTDQVSSLLPVQHVAAVSGIPRTTKITSQGLIIELHS